MAPPASSPSALTNVPWPAEAWLDSPPLVYLAGITLGILLAAALLLGVASLW